MNLRQKVLASAAAMQLALGPIDDWRRHGADSAAANFILGYLTQGSLWAQRCRANRSVAFVEPNLTRSVKWAQAALMDRRLKRSECFRQVRHHDWRGLMSTLEIETEIKKTVHAADAVAPEGWVCDRLGIIDCGRASERTQGVPLLLLFELGTPPTNKLFLF